MADSDFAPQYQRPDSEGGPEVDTGGIVWSNRGTTDNFAVYGDKAAAARQVVDAAFFFWNKVIGSFNQDGGNSQVDVTVTAMARGTGQGGSGGVDTLIGNKPRTSSINLGGGSDRNNNGTVEDAEGFYIDPTPYEYTEFQGDIVNAFTGNATPDGDAEGLWDLFSLVTIEIQHALGVEDRYTNLAWRQDPNDYLQGTSTNDTLDNPGKLWTFNSPNLKALFTSNNGGGGGEDKNYAIHTGRVGNSVTVNGVTYSGQDDTGTTGGFNNKRYLPSYVGVQALADIYGYTVNPPQDVIGTFYSVPDPANRRVLVRNTNNASSDVMEMRSASGGIFVTLNIGADVVGTNLDGPFVAQFPRLAFDSVIMDGGGGNDILRVDGNDGAPVTLRGNSGNDTFDVSLIQRNLDLITGTVTIEGGSNADTILIYDNNDTTGDGTNFTSNAFDTTGFGFMSYSGVEAITYTAGTGSDNITVQSMTTPLTIHANSGNDIVTLGTGAFDANTISAPVAVTGGLGGDRLNIGSGNSDAVAANVSWDGSGGGDSLVYNDQSPTYSINYDVSPTGVNRDGINQPFLVSYLNTQSITINGSAGADTIFVRNGVNASIFAFGNDGNDNFVRGDGNVTATSGAVFNGGNGIDRITFDDHLRPGNLIWDIHNNEVIYGGLILFETTGFESVGILAGNGNDEITFGGNLSQSFNIDGGGGNDTFIIGFQNKAQFLAPVTISGGAGNDNYQWTRGSNNWYTLLSGVSTYPVLLDGGPGYNTLATDETTRTAAGYNLYPDRFYATDGAVFPVGFDIGYDNMQAMSFSAGSGTTNVAVYGTSSDIDPGNQISMSLGGGNDNVYLYPHDAQGNLTINGNVGIGGGAGIDSLFVIDAASPTPAAYAFANPFGAGTQNITGVGSGGFGIGSDFEAITMTGSAGDDVYNIDSYKSGMGLTINAGLGDDVCNFGNGDVAANVTSIASFLFNGMEGTDTFNLRNANPANSFTYTAAANTTLQVSRTFPSSYFVTLEYWNTEQKAVYAGPAVDIMNITSFASGELSFHGAGGDDALNLPTSSDLLGRRVNFFGGAGTANRINQVTNSKTAPSTLHVTPNTIGAFPGDSFFAPGGSVFVDSVQVINLRMGSGADTAYVQPDAVAAISIIGGNPGTAPGDTLNLALASAADYVVNGTPASGNVTSSNLKTLSYTGFETGPNIDDVAPAVVNADININGGPAFADGSARRQSIDVQFSEDASSLISPSSLTLMNLTTNVPIPTADIAVEYDHATNTARFTFPGYADGVLPDGDYEGRVLAGLPDVFGNGLPSDVAFNFFFLQGDANHDRRVNLSDFNILASNFGGSDKTFSEADFNYDGLVNLADFNILAGRFGTVLEEPTARGAGGDLVRSPFSKVRVGDVVKSRHSQGLVTRLNDLLG